MSLCTRDDVTMVDECKQSTTTSSTHVKKTFKWTHFMMVLKRERIFTVIVYVQVVIWSMHFQSIKRNMTIESGNPRACRGDRGTVLFALSPVGCAPTMHTFPMMTPRQSGSPIGGKGNSQTTHGSIVVEWWFTQWLRTSKNRMAVICHRVSVLIAANLLLIGRNW